VSATLDKRLRIVIAINLVFVAVFIVDIVLQGRLRNYGIIPRHVDTWWHIFTSPFIHGSPSHLLNNMLSFSIMAAVCLIRPLQTFVLNSLFIIVVGGAGVWAFGREASHIGASGWIFGLWALSIATAWFNRRLIHILVAIAVLFFHGGMYLGLIPGDNGVSYEAHIFGALAGIACAFLNGRK